MIAFRAAPNMMPEFVQTGVVRIPFTLGHLCNHVALPCEMSGKFGFMLRLGLRDSFPVTAHPIRKPTSALLTVNSLAGRHHFAYDQP